MTRDDDSRPSAPRRHPAAPASQPASQPAASPPVDPDRTLVVGDPRSRLAEAIESVLAEGDLATARGLLSSVAGDPHFERLRRRVDEMARIFDRPLIDEALARAKAHQRSADYRAGVEELGRALRRWPGEPLIEHAYERALRAAERHEAAMGREAAIEGTLGDLEETLSLGDIAGARRRLASARAVHGRHGAFDQVAERIETAVAIERRAAVGRHVAEALRLEVAGDMRGVLHRAEQALGLEPDHEEARALAERSRQALASVEAAQHAAAALEEAARDVERLQAAGELRRAGERLEQALERFGRAPRLITLDAALDRARRERGGRERSEWAERRSHEAASLVEQAASRTRVDDFVAAVDLLERARQLDSETPRIDELLVTARAAAERHEADRRRQEERDETFDAIAASLDALELGAARVALRAARRRWADDPRLDALAIRLHGLRQSASGEWSAIPAEVARLEADERERLVARQDALASAYSWRQAALYPLRGHAARLVAWLAVAFGATALVAQWFDGPGRWLQALVLLVALSLAPRVLRATLQGEGRLSRTLPAHPARDAALGVAAAGVAIGPLAAILLLRPWSDWPAETSGPTPWIVLAALLWLGVAVAALSLVAGVAFGLRHAPRWLAHLRALAPEPTRPLAVLGALYAAVALSIVLRLGLDSPLWVLLVPVSAVFDAWATVAGAHALGVLLRRRRIQWAEQLA